MSILYHFCVQITKFDTLKMCFMPKPQKMYLQIIVTLWFIVSSHIHNIFIMICCFYPHTDECREQITTLLTDLGCTQAEVSPHYLPAVYTQEITESYCPHTRLPRTLPKSQGKSRREPGTYVGHLHGTTLIHTLKAPRFISSLYVLFNQSQSLEDCLYLTSFSGLLPENTCICT